MPWYWPFARQAAAAGALEHVTSRATTADIIAAIQASMETYRPLQQQTLADGSRLAPPETSWQSNAARLLTNGAVSALTQFQVRTFSGGRFVYRRLNNGRLSDYFSSAELQILQEPWPGGTTAKLLGRCQMDAAVAGNSFWTSTEVLRRRGLSIDGERLIWLAPWRMSILYADGPGGVGTEVIGYRYSFDEHSAQVQGGRSVDFLPGEVAHYAPWPDPRAPWRGMSWLTPVVREIQGDDAIGRHVTNYFHNAATPNIWVSYPDTVMPDELQEFAQAFDSINSGPDAAGRTVHIGGGVDLTVVGANLANADASEIIGVGENRLAAAAGIPPILAGFARASADGSIYDLAVARRLYADASLWSWWNDVAAAFGRLVPPPVGGPAVLAIDGRDVPLLRQDGVEEATIRATNAQTIAGLVREGFTAESAISAVLSGDLSLLVHTGLVSVQLLPNTGAPAPGGSNV